MLATLLPATWLSARRRTILAAAPQRRRRHRRPRSRATRSGQFLPAWSPDEAPGCRPSSRSGPRSAGSSSRPHPRRIGIDVSASFALADGLSHTEHRLLVEALGPTPSALVSAEELAVGWLETRLPEEIAALHALNRLVHEVIDEAFSPAVIDVGTTTALDVAWWLRQRLPTWASSRGSSRASALQRAGVPAGRRSGARAARRCRTTRSSSPATWCTATSA